MKRKSLSKKILKISEGLLATAVDLSLVWVFAFKETAPWKDLKKFPTTLSKDLDEINHETLKRAFKGVRQKGWIKENLEVTKKGKERLESILPQYQKPSKWSGNWYTVNYDIPESMRRLRSILRENLKKADFGQVHRSFWISPFNFLGEIEKIVKRHDLQTCVILAISNKVGREPSKILASRVWNLEKINDRYRKFLHKLKSQEISKKEIVFKYYSILENDPQLPRELLPENWLGEEAHQGYLKVIR